MPHNRATAAIVRIVAIGRSGSTRAPRSAQTCDVLANVAGVYFQRSPERSSARTYRVPHRRATIASCSQLGPRCATYTQKSESGPGRRMRGHTIRSTGCWCSADSIGSDGAADGRHTSTLTSLSTIAARSGASKCLQRLMAPSPSSMSTRSGGALTARSNAGTAVRARSTRALAVNGK